MKISKLLLTLLAVLCLAAPAFAEDKEPTAADKEKRKAMHEEMQAEMKAMDEKLDKLVIDMNTATTPDKKIDAAIAVINQMVAQHKKMHQRMHRWGGPGPHHHEHGEGKAQEAKEQNKP